MAGRNNSRHEFGAGLKPDRGSRGVDWINVRDRGAAGTGAVDDTAALQAAISAVPAAGGTVYVPCGTYRLTTDLDVRSNLVLVGDSDGGTVIHQSSTGQNALTGSAVSRLTIENIYFSGPGTGTGTGLALTKGANAATTYVSLRDVTFEGFGQDGFAIENAIVSTFDRVNCVSNGRYGANLYGQQVGAAAGTSMVLNSVYGNGNGAAGIRIFNMVYSVLNGCAGDSNPIAYLIDSCQSLALTGCGAEGNDVGLRVTGGYGVTATSMWVYDNRGVGIHVTGNANTVSLIGATDNTPGTGATNFIKVDSGSHVALMNCNNTSPNSLAAGTTNNVSDNAGEAAFRGYAALLFGGEFGRDFTCYDASRGIVLSDRTDGHLYRLKVTNGVLGTEQVS